MPSVAVKPTYLHLTGGEKYRRCCVRSLLHNNAVIATVNVMFDMIYDVLCEFLALQQVYGNSLAFSWRG